MPWQAPISEDKKKATEDETLSRFILVSKAGRKGKRLAGRPAGRYFVYVARTSDRLHAQVRAVACTLNLSARAERAERSRLFLRAASSARSSSGFGSSKWPWLFFFNALSPAFLPGGTLPGVVPLGLVFTPAASSIRATRSVWLLRPGRSPVWNALDVHFLRVTSLSFASSGLYVPLFDEAAIAWHAACQWQRCGKKGRFLEPPRARRIFME